MIVKDEAEVIKRCLDSAKSLVDFVLIQDTGSSDRTPAIVHRGLDENNTPGLVIHEPWKDFAYNRTKALADLRSRSEIDYALIMDADDLLGFDPGFDVGDFKRNMKADLYDVEIHHANIRHHRPQIFRNSLDFSYRGVVHEFLELPAMSLARETASGIHVTVVGGGARSQDPEKFQRDAEALERALVEEQDSFLRSRYTFYLAQSYRDAGDQENALRCYLARTKLEYWDEEIYVALREAAKLQASLGQSSGAVLDTWQRAVDKVPARLEAYHGAALQCRLAGRYSEARDWAAWGLARTQSPPPVGLFTEQWIYDYGLLDEYAVSSYWSGNYIDCLDACLRMLSHQSLPEDYKGRILTNARFAMDKLRE